ncbi:hypothetical protein BC739_001694 [Kutzneria viridogrisea]|uniref:Uncharacterized protein n=1 Tax=Kutzneria viridogrisea TaxID=47990 RepID=A0ABR6BC93_9PSEU|nr:hypothetical protein [Kutzneria viridogrisea]
MTRERRLFTTWFTSMWDDCEHAVTDEEFAVHRPEPSAVCGDVLWLAPLTYPSRSRCEYCVAFLLAHVRTQLPAPRETGHHRRLGWLGRSKVSTARPKASAVSHRWTEKDLIRWFRPGVALVWVARRMHVLLCTLLSIGGAFPSGAPVAAWPHHGRHRAAMPAPGPDGSRGALISSHPIPAPAGLPTLSDAVSAPTPDSTALTGVPSVRTGPVRAVSHSWPQSTRLPLPTARTPWMDTSPSRSQPLAGPTPVRNRPVRVVVGTELPVTAPTTPTR